MQFPKRAEKGKSYNKRHTKNCFLFLFRRTCNGRDKVLILFLCHVPNSKSVSFFHYKTTNSKASSPSIHSSTISSIAQTKMRNNDHIPVHHVHGPNPKPMKLNRHHSVRYYVHRVHESLTTRVSKMICATFLGLLLIVGLITFILWLSLRPHRPRFHIHEFNMPGLTQNSGFINAVIAFAVSARNSNQNIGINYESMEGAVFYRDQKIGYMPLLFPFYQEPKNTTEVGGELSGASLTVSSERWSEFQSDRADGSVVFRLELTSVIRFKISSWESKRHTMHANCDAGVGPDGSLLTNFKDKRCPVYFS
ncbi:hypothetical protein VNO80_16821 [Phaseolus coccineus]|uniref:Late embryogenesis abundant protein LEA-2 subgroup domain-containing protein n=1 Tax=Phaseolus coccineus TaxID=3886 RepID=A0AAN9MSV6_PHACN